MKKTVGIIFLILPFFTIIPTQRSEAQVEIILEAAKKVIKAMDLMVQRLQNSTIQLQNAQKAVENELSKLKLQEIADWADKQRNLFKTYYDELWQVRDVIAYYQRVKDIVNKQVQIVNEYKDAYQLFSKDTHFSSAELTHIYNVYMGILDQSLKNVEELTLVVNSLTTQMADAKRLEIIHAVSGDVDKNLSDLRTFTRQNQVLSLQRAKDESELEYLKQIYGIQN
jgi:hypothetical protein